MKYIYIALALLPLCSCLPENDTGDDVGGPSSSSSSVSSSDETNDDDLISVAQVLPADPSSSDWVVNSSVTAVNTSHKMIYSESNQRYMGFSVYLPSEYDINDSARYPVVYFLHGKSGSDPNLPGNEVNPTRHLVPVVDAAIENGDIEPMIMVVINGGQFSFYSDFYNGVNMIETYIVDELVPAIDNAYRTKSDSRSRAIEGFSMGGFGAMKLIAQHPETFHSAVSYGGALHTHESFINKYSQNSTGYQDIFNSDENIFNQNSPHYLFTNDRESLLSSNIQISIFSGNLDNATGALSRDFAAHLNSLNFPLVNEDHDVDCGHVLSCYYQQRGLIGLQQHFANF